MPPLVVQHREKVDIFFLYIWLLLNSFKICVYMCVLGFFLCTYIIYELYRIKNYFRCQHNNLLVSMYAIYKSVFTQLFLNSSEQLFSTWISLYVCTKELVPLSIFHAWSEFISRFEGFYKLFYYSFHCFSTVSNFLCVCVYLGTCPKIKWQC